MTSATMPPPAAAQPLLLDWLLPEFDTVLAEHLVIDAEPEAVYRAAMRTDLADIPRKNPAVRGLFATRTAAERLISAMTGRPAPPPADTEAWRLGDMTAHADWVRLGENPPHEFAFGAIGRFWSGETVWQQIDAADFAAFEQPGLAKIACNISLRPYGSLRTLLSYEVRTQALDDVSRASFRRYWRLVRPGVAIVMRGFLRAVAEEVH